MTTPNRIICPKYIDVAVISETLDPVALRADEHIFMLDAIQISGELFKTIFYPSGVNFGLNQVLKNDLSIKPYVSLDEPETKINGVDFCLVDTIYDMIEGDLNVTRDMFTPCSNIALQTELAGLKTLYDLKNLVPTCSLTWDTILSLVNCECENPLNATSVVLFLVISVVFNTPTPGVKPTVIKLVYETTFLVNPLRV